MGWKIGIDTGGTYTDAVLFEDERVLRWAKRLTTRENLAQGVTEALEALAVESPEKVEFVSLSTTLATNGLVENQGGSAALILIGFERDLLQRAGLATVTQGQPVIFVDGGHDASGVPQAPLDEAALRSALADLPDQVEAVAITSLFATRNPEHELRARALVREVCALPVTCGHELTAALDAPRRALTAVINARLISMIQALIDSTQRTLQAFRIDAPLMVVKGDGSLISAEVAQLVPVETILSGPAASVVGAQYLAADRRNAVVVDMGGTTTDIAFLRDGQPQVHAGGAIVGGHRTMVRAVAMHTFGIGGDSWIRLQRQARDWSVGPRRVIPLVSLAAQYENVITDLHEQLQRGYAQTFDGLFAMRRVDEVSQRKMSARQRHLWARIGREPVPVQRLFAEQTLERQLDRLVERGWVALSAFTPTDAMHVLGRLDLWPDAAARLGAQLLARQAQDAGLALADASALAESVRACVSQRMAHSLGEVALQQLLSLPQGVTGAHHAMLEVALAPQPAAQVQLSLRIDDPLIALGAPVADYLPASAERLHTKVICPPYAQVANAVGAVVGLVRVAVQAHITPLPGDRFRLHWAQGTEDFAELEQAVQAGFAHLQALASERAAAGGAGTLSYSQSRQDNVVREQDQDVFFESQLEVVATGRPAVVGAEAV